MAGTVTALKIQKNNKERVNVFIDETFALAVTMVVAANLRKGQYLSETEIEQLKQGDQRDKAYDQALRFLGFRPRSQSETELYLGDKGYSAAVIADVTQRLLDRQYLDDRAFVQFWLENREKFRPRGQRALRYELRQKGISERLIDDMLVDLDEETLAWAAVQNKLYSWRSLSAEALKKKASGFLSRRGFNYEIVSHTVQRILTSLDSSDETESSAWE